MDNQIKFIDDEFEMQFKNGVLNPNLFDHEAHIRLAWIHIKKYGVDTAIKNIDSQLLAFVRSLGVQNKYNKTVTVAAVKAVYHFILKSKSDNFKDFIVEFPRLKTNFKELLESHYGFDIFNSETAKMNYLEPDILPFD